MTDQSTREPFPYTDDFRRAKRNSLVWSGITIAAALGSPAIQGRAVTANQFSFNLTYDQSVLVAMAAAVAIIMAVGFYQATSRLRLYASNLFGGSTDIEGAFSRLSNSASEATKFLDQVETRSGEVVRKTAAITEQCLQPMMQVEAITDRHFTETPPDYRPSMRHDNWVPENDIRELKEHVAALTAWQCEMLQTWENERKRATAHTQEALSELRAFKDELSEPFSAFPAEERNALDERYRKLEAQVSKLRRFHDRIYRSDKVWFWSYDVGLVWAAFGFAMLLTIRPYLPL